jgi:hypothetical protein
MMKGPKIKSLIFLAIGMAVASSAAAKMESPNGQFQVAITANSISIVDAHGAPAFVVNDGPLGATRGTEVKWSSDSQRVVILIQYWKGDLLYPVWYDGAQWHKAAATDIHLPADELAREAGVSGYLKVQQSSLGSWLDDQRVEIKGVLGYSGSAKRVSYEYTLVFTGGPITGRTKTGFETGGVKTVDWHVIR